MITRDTIAKVRELADIAAVVGESVKLVRRGRSLIGLCPFHKEKTPSFTVSPERGRYYCFGCHEHGSAIDFVMKIEGLDFAEAVRTLAQRLGVEVVEEHDTARAPAEQARRAAQELTDVLALAASFFEQQLREHPHASVAHQELQRRGLQPTSATDAVADALQAFRVGYAPPGWDELSSYLQRQKVSMTVAQAAGLVAARRTGSGYYDFFRNRLMFAIVDVHGRVVGFSGRILPDPSTGLVDKNTGKYVNSSESAVYRKGQTVFGLHQARQAIRQQGLAILVEGNFDVVSLHARGIRNVVAPLGTAFTTAQAKLIRRFAPQLVVLFDGDAAGLAAAQKSRAPCLEAGLDVRVATLPEGQDPDAFVREHGPEALSNTVQNARGMLEFLIGCELEKDFAQSDARQKVARVREVARLLASENDPTVRAMAKRYADELAARLTISDATTLRALERELERALDKGAAPARKPTARAWRPDEQRLSLNLLGCLLDQPEIFDQSSVEQALELLEGDYALAAALARKLREQEPAAFADSFLAQSPPTIHDFAAQRLARPHYSDATEALTDFLENARKLKRRGLSREHAQVVEEIDQASVCGDESAEQNLLLEAVRKHRERLGLND